MLWTIFDQQNIKPISKNRQRDFDLLAKEVELTDLQPLIGVEFYNDLVQNPESEWNKKLLDGDVYVIGAQNISFSGLKHALSYFLYARYIAVSDEADTFSGVVVKTTPDSEPLPSGRIKTRVYDTRQIAFAYFNDCSRFISENNSQFPFNIVGCVHSFNRSITYL
jgi:hypothetical protein